MNARHFTAVLILALVGASCATNYSFGHRDPNCNPDQRLEGLVQAYDECRQGCVKTGNSIIFDCSSESLAIERLALEFPRHVPTLSANAVIKYDEGDLVQSRRYLDAVFSLTNSHPEAAILRCRAAIDEGNLQLARRVIETQIAYTPNEPAVHEAHSSVLYMARELDGASRAVAQAEALGAPAWRVSFNRGLIAEAAGRPADAQRLYQAALDQNPDFGPARARLTSARSGS